MKITEFSINNCFSFSNSGLNENNSLSLHTSNLFIGKNNSGKSNVLKALRLLDSILTPISNNVRLQDLQIQPHQLPSSVEDLFFAQEQERVIVFSYTLLIEESDKGLARIINSHPESKNVENPAMMLLKLDKEYPKTVKIAGNIEFKTDNAYVNINSIFIPNNHSTYSKHPIFDRQKSMALVLRDDRTIQDKVWKVAQ
ncbi:AAA family ATPase [Chloroflexota bacterium]